MGDTFVLTLQVQLPGMVTASNPIDISGLEVTDFSVVGSQRSSQGVSINGQAQTSMQITAYLAPARTGELQIPAISVTFQGITYRSDAIDVFVRGGNVPAQPTPTPPTPRQPTPISPTPEAEPEQPGNPNTRFPEQLDPRQPFITASPHVVDPYPGQPFFVDFELFAPARQRWSVIDLQQPSFTDFWFQAVDDPSYENYQVEAEGALYRSRLIARYVVVPFGGGTLEIPPLVASVAFTGQPSIEITSPTYELEAQPLPGGAPRGFSSNNVGDYQFSAELQHDQLRVGDAIRVSMRVQGTGLVALVDLPRLEFEDSIVHDPEVITEQERMPGGSIGGFQQLHYVIIPSKEGPLELGTLDFSYFDPEDGTYQTLSVPLGVLEISGFSPNADVALRRSGTEDEVETVLPPYRVTTNRKTPTTLPFTAFIATAALPCAALLLSLILGVVRKKRAETAPDRVQRSALAKAQRSARGAHRRGDDGFRTLANALRRYLVDRYEIQAGALTAEATGRALRELGIEEALAQKVTVVLETCEVSRFAGDTATNTLPALADEAIEALEALEERYVG